MLINEIESIDYIGKSEIFSILRYEWNERISEDEK